MKCKELEIEKCLNENTSREEIREKIIEHLRKYPKKYRHDEKILAFVPKYTEYGDETLVFYANGAIEIVPKSIKYVFEAYVHSFDKDLGIIRKNRKGVNSWMQPIYLDENNCYMPIRTRVKKAHDDIIYGLYNVVEIAKHQLTIDFNSLLIHGGYRKIDKKRRGRTTYMWLPQGYVELLMSKHNVRKRMYEAIDEAEKYIMKKYN